MLRPLFVNLVKPPTLTSTVMMPAVVRQRAAAGASGLSAKLSGIWRR